MNSDNKQIRDVADVAARIMAGLPAIAEELKGGQVKLDKNHNGKIDGQDFKILRGEKKVKEEVEQLDEIGNTPAGQAALKAVSARGDKEMSDWNKNPKSGFTKAPKKTTTHFVGGMNADRRLSGQGISKGKEGQAQRQIDYAKKMRGEEVDLGEAKDEQEYGYEGVMEGLPQILRKFVPGYAKREIDRKMDAQKFGRTDVDRDANYYRYKKIQDKLKRGEVKKEEVEQLDEVKLADLPSRKIQGRAYGSSRPEPHAVDTIKGPNDAELKKIEAEKKKKKFSEMVNLYQDKGLKSLSEMLAKEETVEEGASEAEYNAQLDVAKFKANTKDGDGAMPVKQKTTMVPKATQLSVKSEETHTTVEIIDLNDVNGVQYSEIELAQERTLTAAETNKKEEIVKSMKKGLAGFKDRYGDRAKEVMYATATKQAKKD